MKKASPARTIFGVGAIGAIAGGVVYFIKRRRRHANQYQVPPGWCLLPPEPVERDPNAVAHQAPAERGHYR